MDVLYLSKFAVDTVYQPCRIGDPEHFSRSRSSLQVPLAVTWRDRPTRPTFGFRSIAGALRLAQPPGSQPGREVPDDHCHPIHRARHDPARLHRPRTARPRRVPGRVPRPDPRGVRAGPAPVHHLVPRPLPAPVRGPPRRHRRLRPRPGSQWPRPRHRHPTAVHHRRVLQVRRRRRAPGSLTRPRTSAARGWTTSLMPPPWTATNWAPCWSPPGSARRPSTR